MENNFPSRIGNTPLPKRQPSTRQTDLIAALSSEPATERQILDRVGNTRYTREILRKLIFMNVVERLGKGGAHEPYRYRMSRYFSPQELSRAKDPILERRMSKIETVIVSMLSKDPTKAYSERCIRDIVGDNTGTGKALRRLVKSLKVHVTLCELHRL